MMKTIEMLATVLLLSAIYLSGYEEPPTTEETDIGEQKTKDLFHLSFRVAQPEHIPLSQTIDMSCATDVGQVCTRTGLALFESGVRAKDIHQDTKDVRLGQVSVTLPAGTYRTVAVAHSGGGSATITSPEEVSLPEGKMTDTFHYCQEVTVGGNASCWLKMKHAIAVFKLVTTGITPTVVKAMKFYCTDDSSTFGALAGADTKNSCQTKKRAVTDAQYTAHRQFDVCTLPHTPSNMLRTMVFTLGASGDIIAEHTFEEVPVKVNEIT